MTFKTFLRASGASTLAAAIALTAVGSPAMAQERRDGSDRSEARQQAREARQAQRQSPARDERQASVRAAPEVTMRQPQARPQRTYQAPQAQSQARAQAPSRSGSDWNRGDNRSTTGSERQGRDWNQRGNTSNDWGQARAAQAQQSQAAQRARAEAQAQAIRNRAQGGDNRWDRGNESRSGSNTWERNRSYTDRDRNGTYRNGYRDGRTADNRQDRYQQQNAYRSGYRDGVRNDNYRDGRHSDRNRYSGDYRRWSHDWRRDNRYDWQRYRTANRSIFRLGAYYSPYSNYRYSRVNIGFRLNSLFFGSRYWINDPWQYRLPAAYGPYRWIRYYDDALLVDTYSGEVVDVIYDFFW